MNQSKPNFILYKQVGHDLIMSNIPNFNRATITYDTAESTDQNIENKTILIIGGSGSLGNALTRRLINQNKIVIYSRGEMAQWNMRQKYKHDLDKLSFVIGDVKNKDALVKTIFTHRPNIIILAAAMKHIDICESQISECIDTNVDGIGHVIDFVIQQHEMGLVPFLECLLFVSTDKACSPVNVYGMCKCISERRMVNNSQRIKSENFKIVSVRYGNVLASNGSLFQKLNLIGSNDEYSYFGITDERMTRFFMSLDQSVTLIINSVLYGPNGHICIPKIPSYSIMDIIKFYSVKYGKPIKNIGIRPGEKIHESMINEVEGLRTSEHKHFMTIGPDHGNIDPHRQGISYCSSDHVQPIYHDGVYIFDKYLPQDEI